MSGKKTKDTVVSALDFGSGLVSFCAVMLAVVLILYSGYVLYDSMAIEMSAFSANSDLLKYKPAVMGQVSEPSLADVNPDYRAWITVEGEPLSPIDYPVVQGEDDLYYATHDATGTLSLTGAIYLAAGNRADLSDSYNLLYGHHMDNSAMFGSLDKFKDKHYFDSHRTATVMTKDGTVYDVIFFALVSTDAYEDRIYTVGDRAGDVLSFLTGSRENDAGIGTRILVSDWSTANGAEQIIALSTCASADTNGRLVLFGKMSKTKDPPPAVTPETTAPQTPTATPTKKPGGGKATPTPTPTPTPAQEADGGTKPAPSPTQPQKSGGGTKTTTPSPTPETSEPVKLTVKFVSIDGQVFPEQIIYYESGDNYYVVAPQRPGYDVDVQIVRGTIQEDMTVIIHYTPKKYTLTIRYILPDGTKVAEPYTSSVGTGESYDVPSPKIEGYKAIKLRISGTNPGRNLQYTVIYIPETQEIGELPTALGLETTFMQVGVCFE